MPLEWPTKDQDEVLDYQMNWLARLDGDTIDTSTWVVPAGLVKDSDTFSGPVATVWLSGGTDGENYTLLNRITTTGGRTMDQSVKLRVRPK